MMVLIIFQIYKKVDAAGVRNHQPEGPSETIPHFYVYLNCSSRKTQAY